MSFWLEQEGCAGHTRSDRNNQEIRIHSQYQNKEKNMTPQTNKSELKRLPKSQRKHVRRMKQEARKEGAIYNAPKVHLTPAKITAEAPKAPAKK
jgi:hypothetical protein